MSDKLIVFCTCSSAEEAERVSRRLLEDRLAACVNIVPGVRSLYWWEEEIEESFEALLMVKTSQDRFDAVRLAIEATHSYAVPEVVAVPVERISQLYLEWWSEQLTETQDSGK